MNSHYEITEEKYLEYLARIECGWCKARVSLETIKQQMAEEKYWRMVSGHVGGVLCAGCAHALFDEHDPCPEGLSSHTCRCGVVVQYKF